jgi:hypothetical protein
MSPAGSELSAREAARVVGEAHAWDSALKRRSEGIVWMVWGIVLSAMFVSYGYASASRVPPWVFATLWAPWSAAGILTTIAIQRVVRAHAPPAPPVRGARALVGIAVVALAFTLMGALLHPSNALEPLMIDGAIWTVAAALNSFRFTGEGRVMVAATGVGTLVVAAALWILHPSDDAQGLVATFTTGILALGSGAARVLKG